GGLGRDVVGLPVPEEPAAVDRRAQRGRDRLTGVRVGPVGLGRFGPGSGAAAPGGVPGVEETPLPPHAVARRTAVADGAVTAQRLLGAVLVTDPVVEGRPTGSGTLVGAGPVAALGEDGEFEGVGGENGVSGMPEQFITDRVGIALFGLLRAEVVEQERSPTCGHGDQHEDGGHERRGPAGTPGVRRRANCRKGPQRRVVLPGGVVVGGGDVGPHTVEVVAWGWGRPAVVPGPAVDTRIFALRVTCALRSLARPSNAVRCCPPLRFLWRTRTYEPSDDGPETPFPRALIPGHIRRLSGVFPLRVGKRLFHLQPGKIPFALR